MENQKYCPVCGEPLTGRYCVNCGFDTEKKREDVRAELTSDADRPPEIVKSAEAEIPPKEPELRPVKPGVEAKTAKKVSHAVFQAVPDSEAETAKLYAETAKKYAETAKKFAESASFGRKKSPAPNAETRKQAGNAIRIANASRVFGAIFAVLGFLLMLAPVGFLNGERCESAYYLLSPLLSSLSLYPVVVFLLFSYSLLLAVSMFGREENIAQNCLFVSVAHAFTLGAGIWFIVKMKQFYAVPSVAAYLLPSFAALGFALSVSLFFTSLKEKKAAGSSDAKSKSVSVRKKIVFHAVAAVLVVAVGAAVVCGVTFSDRFRAGKVDDIKMQYNRTQVKDILGEPIAGTAFNADVYEYFSDDYADLTTRIDDMENRGLNGTAAALKEERDRLTYRYIRVSFGRYGNVREVLFDAARCDGKNASYANKWDIGKKGGIVITPSTCYYADTVATIYASVYYKDGSFKKSFLPSETMSAIDTMILGEQILRWSDEWGSYTASIEVKKR